MLLLGGKLRLSDAINARLHVMQRKVKGNRLQEAGYLSARASHKWSPLPFSSHVHRRTRPAQLRINRGEACRQKSGRGSWTGTTPRPRPAQPGWSDAPSTRHGNAILFPLFLKIDCQKQQRDIWFCRTAKRPYGRPSPSILPRARLSMGCLSHV